MKTKHLRKGIGFLAIALLAVSLTMCTNAKKGTKKDMKNMQSNADKTMQNSKQKTNQAIADATLTFDYKIAHAKALLSLEQAKVHFLLENDYPNTKADLERADKYLSSIENSSNKTYNKDIAKIRGDINDTKQGVGKDKNATKSKLENLEREMTLRTDKLDNVKAKNYGNDRYSATIDALRLDISKATNSLVAKEAKAPKEIDVVIEHLGKKSNQVDEYQYIAVP